MARLGQLLLQAELVTENNLAGALGIQHFAGGRLGTLLLERGSLGEDDLGRALGQQHGCEYVPWTVLANVPPGVIATLPAKFAIRHSAVPYDRREGFLRVALRDPSDLRILDELFFVTGRKIVPGVAPEVRIFQALEKYYGERRTPRFAILAEKLSRGTGRPSQRPAAPPPPPDFFPVPPPPPDFFPAPPASAKAPVETSGAPPRRSREPSIPVSQRIPDAPVAPPWAPLASQPGPSSTEEEQAISWEDMTPDSLWLSPPPPVAPVAAPPRTSPPPPPVAPAPERAREVPASTPAAPPARPSPSPRRPRRAVVNTLPEKFDFPEVLAAPDRDAVARSAVAALARRFPRVAFFTSRPERVSGLLAAGRGVDSARIAAVKIPWNEPSLFLNVRLSRAFYLGPLPPLPRHRAIAGAMGRWAEECVLQPVVIREKPAAFLYAEFDPDRGATPMDLAYLRELASAAATALAASIRLKKRGVI